MNRKEVLLKLMEKLLNEECFNEDNYNGDTEAMLKDALEIALQHFDGYVFIKGEVL